MAAPCNEEQRRQAARKPCNRVRSDLTFQVNIIDDVKNAVFTGLSNSQAAVN
ncbi:MAG: hypothetical protein J5I92_12680 [Thiogranum sp.]|nr:hypothetical protein [Thiogranum sp.]